MTRLLSSLWLLSLLLSLAALVGCPDGQAEGEGEGAEGEGEAESAAAFTLVSTVDLEADLLVVPGFAITARSDGRFAVAWFEPIAEVVECALFGGGTVDGEVYRLMLADEQADGSVTTRVVDDFVPNVREDSVDLAVSGDDRILVAYLGGEVTRTFCGGSDLMLAVENGAGFDIQTVADTSDTGVVCRGTAGGDPYCNRGEVVGLYPSISVNGDDVAISYLDTHFGFADDDITQTDLELAHGTLAGFTVTSINMESGGGYYGDCSVTVDGRVIIGHNVTGNNQFLAEDGSSFVVEDGIYVEVVDAATGAVLEEEVLMPGVATASRVATAAFPGQGLFVLVHNRGNESLSLFNSIDNGTTWIPSAVESLGRTGRDPNLIFTDDGRLVLVYAHCRNDTNQDGCSGKDDGVRFTLRDDDGRFKKFTLKGDTEDIEGVGLDAARSGPSEIVTVSLNASQSRLTVNRVRVN